MTNAHGTCGAAAVVKQHGAGGLAAERVDALDLGEHFHPGLVAGAAMPGGDGIERLAQFCRVDNLVEI
jgi:hypothetical protein